MALTVELDTYTTLADAEAYMAGRPYADDWTGASDAEKEKALRAACRIMDRLDWTGAVATSTQLLAWPRTGTSDRHGRTVDADTIPDAVKEAQAELALRTLSENPFEDDGNRGIRRVKAGSTEVEYAGQAPAKALPDVVLDMLRPFLRPAPTASASMRF